MPSVLQQQSVSFEGATRVLTEVTAEADQLGVAVCVAVADRAGHLVAFGRMDGAPPGSGRPGSRLRYVPSGVQHGREPWPFIVVDKQPEPVLGRDDDLDHQQRIDAEIAGKGRCRGYVRSIETRHGAENLGDAGEHLVLRHHRAS
jgi:hypothetical protein